MQDQRNLKFLTLGFLIYSLTISLQNFKIKHTLWCDKEVDEKNHPQNQQSFFIKVNDGRGIRSHTLSLYSYRTKDMGALASVTATTTFKLSRLWLSEAVATTVALFSKNIWFEKFFRFRLTTAFCGFACSSCISRISCSVDAWTWLSTLNHWLGRERQQCK